MIEARLGPDKHVKNSKKLTMHKRHRADYAYWKAEEHKKFIKHSQRAGEKKEGLKRSRKATQNHPARAGIMNKGRKKDKPQRAPSHIDASRHSSLVDDYLYHIDHLHLRRTPDRYHYPTLPDSKIRKRDLDQVLYRYTRDLPKTVIINDNVTQLHRSTRLLMVDQLWLWKIDHPGSASGEITIITAFPERWSELDRGSWRWMQNRKLQPSEKSDIRFRILRVVMAQNDGPLRTADDFVCLVIDKCSSLFHPQPPEADLLPQMSFRDALAISIGTLVSFLTKLDGYTAPILICLRGVAEANVPLQNDDETTYYNRLCKYSQRIYALRARWNELSQAPLKYRLGVKGSQLLLDPGDSRQGETDDGEDDAPSPEKDESSEPLSKPQDNWRRGHYPRYQQGHTESTKSLLQRLWRRRRGTVDVETPTSIDEKKPMSPSSDPLSEGLQRLIDRIKEFRPQQEDASDSEELEKFPIPKSLKKIQHVLESRNIRAVEEQIRAEAERLIDVTEEIDCLKETKDVVDELSAICSVFTEQQQIVQDLVDDVHGASFRGIGPDQEGRRGQTSSASWMKSDGGPSGNSDAGSRAETVNTRSEFEVAFEKLEPDAETVPDEREGNKLEMESDSTRVRPLDLDSSAARLRLLATINRRLSDLQQLREDAKSICTAINELLDLKQKHATVIEAYNTRRDADETSKQSSIVLAFTITAIIHVSSLLRACITSLSAIPIS